MTGPLSGIRVVALAGLGPVPFASMLLADMGADVVRVTRPPARAARQLSQTEGLTASFDLPNRGTRSVSADLKSRDGLREILALASAADVFIEGYRPGVAERLGLGPDTIREANPALIYARLTGFGQDSEYSLAAGHDINYIAESGVLHMLGRPGEHPRPPVNLLGDYGGGGSLAAFGIASALVHSQRTGQGQVLDAAMVDGSALLTTKLLGLQAAGVMDGSPGTHFIDGAAPFYTTYECADGRFLAVGALEDTFYRAFVAHLGVDTSSWPVQSDRDSWSHLGSLIAEVIAQHPLQHWVDVYADVDACVSPVLTPEESQERHARRGVYTTVGGVRHPTPVPRLSRTPVRTPTAPSAHADLVESVLHDWNATSGSW